MKNIPTQFNDSPAAVVRIYAEYDCDTCHDSGRVELPDSEGFPSGYYQDCYCSL